MRLRRRIFQPDVRTTREAGRPITVVLAGLEFDLSTGETKKLADALWDALAEIEERQRS